MDSLQRDLASFPDLHNKIANELARGTPPRWKTVAVKLAASVPQINHPFITDTELAGSSILVQSKTFITKLHGVKMSIFCDGLHDAGLETLAIEIRKAVTATVTATAPMTTSPAIPSSALQPIQLMQPKPIYNRQSAIEKMVSTHSLQKVIGQMPSIPLIEAYNILALSEENLQSAAEQLMDLILLNSQSQSEFETVYAEL